MCIFLAFASKSESLAVSAYQVRVFSVSTVVEIYKSTTQEGAVFDKQSHPCGKQCPVLDKNVRDAQWCSVMRRKKVCDVTHNFTILKMSIRRKVMAKRLCWRVRIRKKTQEILTVVTWTAENTRRKYLPIHGSTSRFDWWLGPAIQFPSHRMGQAVGIA